MKTDISINGSMGFYSIQAETRKGANWMRDNLAEPFNGCCDDTGMTQDIADGAHEDGLRVTVNGKRYIGNNRVAA